MTRTCIHGVPLADMCLDCPAASDELPIITDHERRALAVAIGTARFTGKTTNIGTGTGAVRATLTRDGAVRFRITRNGETLMLGRLPRKDDAR